MVARVIVGILGGWLAGLILGYLAVLLLAPEIPYERGLWYLHGGGLAGLGAGLWLALRR